MADRYVFERFFPKCSFSFVAALEWPLSLVVRVSPKSSVVIDASQIGFYNLMLITVEPTIGMTKDKPAGRIQPHMVVESHSVLFEATTF